MVSAQVYHVAEKTPFGMIIWVYMGSLSVIFNPLFNTPTLCPNLVCWKISFNLPVSQHSQIILLQAKTQCALEKNPNPKQNLTRNIVKLK